MHGPSLLTLTFASLALASSPLGPSDFAAECYNITLPSDIPASADNRTIPWDQPSLTLSNGTECCGSLDQVRAGIDEVDEQIVALVALRAGYVREATRFKATLDTVDVPSRDAAVINGAVEAADAAHLPQTIAEAVFSAIINASVPFEQCVFNTFENLTSGP